MLLTKIIDKLPWRIQTFLGYRPKKVITDILKLDSKKIKWGEFVFDISVEPNVIHCENNGASPFTELKNKVLLEKFATFYVIELEKCTYLNTYGYDTFIQNNCIIEPLSIRRDKRDFLGDFTKTHPALTIFKYPEKKILKGNVLNLCTMGAENNYGHWTMDLMPKIGYLTKLGFTFDDFEYILINKHPWSFQKEMLSLIGLPKEKIIETSVGDCYYSEKMIVPSHDTFSMYGHSFLRNRFLDILNKSSLDKNTPKRIYISRKNAKWSKVTNENEIDKVLNKYSFEQIAFENYSVLEQINFMNNADFVIGVQGSGLINTIYQKFGSKIIEICNKNNIVLTYSIFGRYNSLNQGVVFADPVPNDDTKYSDNLFIDPVKLENLIKKMI